MPTVLSRPARSRIVRTIAGVALVALVAAPLRAQPASWADRIRRLVVVYVIGSTRADHLASYGYHFTTTPNVDVLASESVVFDQALAPAPENLASVASLLTGVLACSHGLVGPKGVMNPRLATLAQVLNEAGFQTAVFAPGAYGDPRHGLTRGFQVQSRGRRLRIAPIRRWLRRGAGEQVVLCVFDPSVQPFTQIDPQLAQPFGGVKRETLDRMERVLDLHQRLLRRKRGERVAGPARLRRKDQIKATIWDMRNHRAQLLAAYDGALFRADQTLGELIELLRAEGLWDRTLFVLTSDCGIDFGEHGTWLVGQSVYQTALHVPLMIHFPDDSVEPRHVTRPVSLLDVLPTLGEVLGVPTLGRSPLGRSLMPRIVGGDTPDDGDGPRVVSMRIKLDTYFQPWYRARGHRNVVVLDGRYKLIFNSDHDSYELYDLLNDPRERHDLSDSRPELLERMRAALTRPVRDCVQQYVPRTEELLRKLDPETQRLLKMAGVLNDDERAPASAPASQPAGIP